MYKFGFSKFILRHSNGIMNGNLHCHSWHRCSPSHRGAWRCARQTRAREWQGKGSVAVLSPPLMYSHQKDTFPVLHVQNSRTQIVQKRKRFGVEQYWNFFFRCLLLSQHSKQHTHTYTHTSLLLWSNPEQKYFVFGL